MNAKKLTIVPKNTPMAPIKKITVQIWAEAGAHAINIAYIKVNNKNKKTKISIPIKIALLLWIPRKIKIEDIA